MASPTEYNLFIKPSKIQESINCKDDKSTEYIILQNNTLFTQHLADVKEITDLKAQVEELEEYNGNLERGKTCIQGIAKNQYLLNQEKTKCIDHYKAKLNASITSNMYANCFTIPLLLTCFVNIFAIKAAICVIVATMQAHFVYKNYLFYKNIEKNESFVETLEQIKNLDKSSETLHDLIDNY